MKAPSKKTWIIVGIIAAVGLGIGGFFYWKKRKAISEALDVEMETQSEEEPGGGATTSVGKIAAPASTIASPVSSIFKAPIAADIAKGTGVQYTQVPGAMPLVAKTVASTIAKPAIATVATASPSVLLPAGTAKINRVIKDDTKGKAIVQVSPKGLFKVGETVNVQGSVYKGRFKIWYIYKTHQVYDNLYIETPYISDDSGIVTK
jgi:hypothetical protein